MEIDPTANRSIKIVAVGDHLVGKSYAITTFITSQAPLERHSTVFDSSACDIRVDGASYSLSIWDTTGNESYGNLIKSCYKDADIFLIFFSVIDPASFQNATKKWYTEVTQANEKALVFFVGSKTDQRREGSTGEVVTRREAQGKIEGEFKCKYLECSSMTSQGLQELFEYAVRQYVLTRNGANGKTGAGGAKKQKRRNNDNTCCEVM